MTTFLLGALVAFAMSTAIECYVLIGRVQLLFTYAEQLLVVGKALLAAMPGKSAERTTAADDVLVQSWFPRLRLLSDLRDLLRDLSARPGVDPHTTVKDALTAETPVDVDVDTDPETTVDEDETPTETLPATPSDTAPVERVEIAGGLRIPPEGREPTKPEVDDVDARLARFTYAEGHQR